ncbi:hypothetical protein BDL97_17G009900, partial [Sphagnum fallax]
YWPLARNFGLNKNLLETNLINLGVVLSLLVYFRKGITIGDVEKRYEEVTDKLRQAQIYLQRAKVKVDEIRVNRFSQMEREKQELIHHQVFCLKLERASKALNNRLNGKLHSRMIDYHIGLFRAMENTID